jgi:hypothetical protein
MLQPDRNVALMQLAGEIPAPVLGDLLASAPRPQSDGPPSPPATGPPSRTAPSSSTCAAGPPAPVEEGRGLVHALEVGVDRAVGPVGGAQVTLERDEQRVWRRAR